MGVYAANANEPMVRRLILTLASLAVVAERAALRSDTVCRHVDWFLWQAESAVGYFVFEATGTPPPSAYADQAEDDNGPLEALRLAACFKALAAILGALLLVARRRSFPVASALPCDRRPVNGRTPKPHDTS